VPGSPMEVEGTQHHFTRNGRLVANKQLVFQIDQLEGMTPVSPLYFNYILIIYFKIFILKILFMH
jgi:hypothetical protein